MLNLIGLIACWVSGTFDNPENVNVNANAKAIVWVQNDRENAQLLKRSGLREPDVTVSQYTNTSRIKFGAATDKGLDTLGSEFEVILLLLHTKTHEGFTRFSSGLWELELVLHITYIIYTYIASKGVYVH